MEECSVLFPWPQKCPDLFCSLCLKCSKGEGPLACQGEAFSNCSTSPLDMPPGIGKYLEVWAPVWVTSYHFLSPWLGLYHIVDQGSKISWGGHRINPRMLWVRDPKLDDRFWFFKMRRTCSCAISLLFGGSSLVGISSVWGHPRSLLIMIMERRLDLIKRVGCYKCERLFRKRRIGWDGKLGSISMGLVYTDFSDCRCWSCGWWASEDLPDAIRSRFWSCPRGFLRRLCSICRGSSVGHRWVSAAPQSRHLLWIYPQNLVLWTVSWIPRTHYTFWIQEEPLPLSWNMGCNWKNGSCCIQRGRSRCLTRCYIWGWELGIPSTSVIWMWINYKNYICGFHDLWILQFVGLEDVGSSFLKKYFLK